jgi:hypothetical protein
MASNDSFYSGASYFHIYNFLPPAPLRELRVAKRLRGVTDLFPLYNPNKAIHH